LSGAARLEGRFGGGHLSDLVTGSDSVQIRKYNHQQLPTFGRLSSMPKRRVQALIQALVRQGYLHQEGLRYPMLTITENGRAVMHNKVQARLGNWEPAAGGKSRKEPPYRSSSAAAAAPVQKDSALREALRDWRARKSKEMAVPPYTLFWDRTLDELCARRPATAIELLSVWGIGEQKQRVFGAELLELIAANKG
jgi:ATP-dependent DNA helicase RecQ